SFFPAPVVAPDGTLSFACMHRPMTGGDHRWSSSSHLADLPSSIWVSYVPVADVLRGASQLLRLRQHRLVLRPEFAWEHVKVGGGAPPILTEDGWLLFYHGIEDLAGAGEPGRLRYAAGAFLVDRDDVSRVTWRSSHAILAPCTEEEMSGVVDNVVFPTGVDLVDDQTVDVYYGMADARIGVARAYLRTVAAVTPLSGAA
ncbi:MAG: glycosidase, partial [Chloroflexi bacterium]|nr:glycosidase [Chloroflexota bacterium]